MQLPEVSLPLSHFRKSQASPSQQKVAAGAVQGGSSVQDRSTFRPIYIRAHALTGQRGSAYMELGETKVLCAVDGPKEVSLKSGGTDFASQSSEAVINVTVKFASLGGCSELCADVTDEQLRLSTCLRDSLSAVVCQDKISKAQLDVHCTVLDDQGGVLPALLMCSAAALADAAIEIYDVVLAASVLVVHGKNEKTVIDPTASEIESCHSQSRTLLTVGLMPSLNQVIACEQSGCCSVQNSGRLIKMSTDACLRLHPIVQKALTKILQK